MPLAALSRLRATQNGSVNSACLITEHERQGGYLSVLLSSPSAYSTGHQLLLLSEIGQGALESCRGVRKHRDHPSLWRVHPGNGKLPSMVEGTPGDANSWGDLDAKSKFLGLGREGGAKWLQRTTPSGIHHKQGAPPGG